MDLPYGDERSKQFITNVGLITSDGPFGPNVMACEWTHHISYSPGLVAVCILSEDATYTNIIKTKEFGINLCATDQTALSSVSGNQTGKEVDKIAALKELGFTFHKAKRIKAPMVHGAVLNVECRLIKKIILGDHVMLVGEALETAVNTEKKPLAYYQGKYWRMDTNIPKPSDDERGRIRAAVEKWGKK